MTNSQPPRPPHKSEWVLNQVTDELNARPFPRFGAPTALFRLCLAGEQARGSLHAALAAQLTDIDWDSDAKLMRSTQDGVQFNIEQHTEFVSLTIIDERADGVSPARKNNPPRRQYRPSYAPANHRADGAPRGADNRDGWSPAYRRCVPGRGSFAVSTVSVS